MYRQQNGDRESHCSTALLRSSRQTVLRLGEYNAYWNQTRCYLVSVVGIVELSHSLMVCDGTSALCYWCWLSYAIDSPPSLPPFLSLFLFPSLSLSLQVMFILHLTLSGQSKHFWCPAHTIRWMQPSITSVCLVEGWGTRRSRWSPGPCLTATRFVAPLLVWTRAGPCLWGGFMDSSMLVCVCVCVSELSVWSLLYCWRCLGCFNSIVVYSSFVSWNPLSVILGLSLM